MKILILINSFGTGGAERQAALLSKGLYEQGHSVTIVAFSLSEVKEINVGKDFSVESFLSLSPNSKNGFKSITKFVWLCHKLIRIINKNSPDIIQSFLPASNFLAPFFSRLSSKKVVISTSWRSLPNYRNKNQLFFITDYIAQKISTYNIYNSQAVMRSTSFSKESKKDFVIYNGFEESGSFQTISRKNLELKDDEIAICHVANLIPYKGHEDLIRALGYLCNTHPDLKWKLYLFGEDRGIKKNLEDLARKEKVSDRIYFLGQCQDVHNYLSAMDIGVLPSHEEGFSNALIEKLATGLPVIAAKVGGNPEALEGLENCFLVNPHSPKELAEALAKLIKIVVSKKDNSQKRANYITNKYTVEKMVNSYIKLYESKL
ncbi:MAG: hypothetical protein CMM87_03195 [Rickettsiales bacterium]|nr:hypothetical protein [Rickettsiales bacterium]|tara:strand:- start:6482 stop:7606 length:1125 start_codon:yes stop_codon:yes gene_type:complete